MSFTIQCHPERSEGSSKYVPWQEGNPGLGIDELRQAAQGERA